MVFTFGGSLRGSVEDGYEDCEPGGKESSRKTTAVRNTRNDKDLTLRTAAGTQRGAIHSRNI